MTDRIDFALDPTVLIAVVAILVLISILLGSVVYPYLRDASTQEERMDSSMDEDEQEDTRDLDDRIDDFIEHAHKDKMES